MSLAGRVCSKSCKHTMFKHTCSDNSYTWNLIIHSSHLIAVQQCMQLYILYCQSCTIILCTCHFLKLSERNVLLEKFCITYSSAKTVKLFHLKQFALYGNRAMRVRKFSYSFLYLHYKTKPALFWHVRACPNNFQSLSFVLLSGRQYK